jgi:hypothetical protein
MRNPRTPRHLPRVIQKYLCPPAVSQSNAAHGKRQISDIGADGMVIIYNRAECTREEMIDILGGLCMVQERELVTHILRGARVQKGVVRGLSDLGRIRTKWKHLGTIDIGGGIGNGNSKRFRVREVMEALNQPLADLQEYCERLQIVQRINRYKQQINKNQLKMSVALVEKGDELVLCDGSEKVTALYEFGKEKHLENSELPVCVITLQSGLQE